MVGGRLGLILNVSSFFRRSLSNLSRFWGADTDALVALWCGCSNHFDSRQLQHWLGHIDCAEKKKRLINFLELV